MQFKNASSANVSFLVLPAAEQELRHFPKETLFLKAVTAYYRTCTYTLIGQSNNVCLKSIIESKNP